MSVHLFGIRHHGPGSARALEQALHELQPDCVLIEGPPEADGLLALAADGALVPPVALLIYPPEAPRLAVFYPFAEFSPEWRAIRHAVTRGVPVQFMDLPQTHELAERHAQQQAQAEHEAIAADRFDPVAALSQAAGYADDEQWWEQQVEHRRDGTDLFAAIQQAMTALREQAGPVGVREQRREASMRQAIRAAEKAGHARIAVVCGAWHVPALAQKVTVKDDQALLKGLPKIRVEAAWIPWSNDRLARESGYGAGVQSPGWYQHVWQDHPAPVAAWATRAAQQIRRMELDASSASVIEAVRLAEALAALRGQSAASLAEINEALLTVLCHGDAAMLTLVRRQLEIGDVIGTVPAEGQLVPLQRDLEAEQKRLRLKPSTEIKRLELDLREDNGRERSHLLHRLSILGVDWGELAQVAGKSGTFHEHWSLQWQPELQLKLIEAGRYGGTLQEAAAARLIEAARDAADLPQLTARLDQSLLAQLPEATSALLQAVSTRAAQAADIQHLMQSLGPLSRIARYGDVRGTAGNAVRPIIGSLLERIIVGLPLSCASLDDDSAAAMLDQMAAVQASVDTLDEPEWRNDWQECLQRLAHDAALAAPIRGYSLRLLFDHQQIDADEIARLAGLALSPAVPPLDAAAWLGGLLRGSGLMLLNQDKLWRILDGWLRTLSHEQFQTLLPLLRRAFADFSPAERRRMHGKVRNLDGGVADNAATDTLAIDIARAQRVLPVLRELTGVAT